jgi:diguanylate cyclase (GGDEF)-like protein/PAS domain S-box-containing protein
MRLKAPFPDAVTPEPRESKVIDFPPARIVYLDAGGFILNSGGARWPTDCNVDWPARVCGGNYLTACDEVQGADALAASRASAGIRSVLRGEAAQFSMEYVKERESGDTWILLVVTPVSTEGREGVALMHLDISARKQDETTGWRFAQTMDALAEGVVFVDRASMTLTYVNDAACRLYGVTREAALALKPWEFTSLTREELECKYDRIVTQGGIGETEETLVERRTGTPLWLEVRRHAHCIDGAVNLVVLLRDITARKTAESRIGYLNRVHAVLSGINALIVRVRDREELLREASRIAVEKAGFPVCWIGTVDRRTGRVVPVAAAGMDPEYQEALTHRLVHGADEALERSYVSSAVREKRLHVCNDSRNDERALVADQHEAHGIRSFAIIPLIVGGEVVGVVALYAAETDFFHQEELRLLSELASDVSFAIDHLEKQQRLDYLAFYDVLTGLANPRLFLERVGQFARTAEAAGTRFALCVTDLERFRNINDSLGRLSGDGLLRQVADWLLEHVDDPLRVARLDADRFAVVLDDVKNENEAALHVEKLVNSFVAHQFCLDDRTYRIALKAGVVMFPDDGREPHLLFKNAGAALTKAKAGKDRYLFYAQRMTETVAGRLGMENQLRQALERNQFVLHYQPKFNLASGQLVGVEALLRWNDPLTGLVPPARFIPVLEETGLIFEAGRWVIQQAIEDHGRWRRAGYPDVRIAVNVSPLQLRDGSFATDIERYVCSNPYVSSGLELEITESLIMEDVKRSIAALQVIRAFGITIAIDDFGTGYSSLSQLAKLPVDTLKIDGSFIFDMSAAPAGLTLVSTIINLAHSLGLKVVAEGVEKEDQEEMLRRLACDEVQGYLYSKPIPAAAFAEKYFHAEAMRPMRWASRPNAPPRRG